MEAFLAALDNIVLGNSVSQWLQALLAYLVTFVIVTILRRWAAARRDSWPQIQNPLLEMLAMLAANTRRVVVLILALYIAEKTLNLPPDVDHVFDIIIIVGVAIQLAVWLTTALRFHIRRRHGLDEWGDSGDRSQISIVMFLGQIIIWALVTVLALDNLGVNITALVAGLGIGGIAIALSVQTILVDLFGSLSIAFDKPFVIGDTLRVDDVEGTVESVGIKSTRLRSVTGEQIILSNADLLKSRVRNLGRMPEKRIVTRLRVAYESAPAVVDQLPKLAEEVVKGQPDARFVSCMLAELGVYSLEFDLIYFVPNLDALNIPRTVNAVNGTLFRRMAEAGIRFAYPAQRQFSAAPPAPPPPGA